MKNILLVHYNSEVIDKISGYLFHDMFDLTIAGDASEARALLVKKSFDLVITASLLPKSHGFTLAKYVRETFPNTRVFIICDQLEDETYLRQGYESGACEILEKSVKKKEFQEKVSTHLGLNFPFLFASPVGDNTRIDLKSMLYNLKSVQSGNLPPEKSDGFDHILQDVQNNPESFEIKLD
jgi:DNA-binding response OmpR family regulator